MSQIRNILNESTAFESNQMNQTKGLVRKWEKTGLLKGLKNAYSRHGMAILLENQAKQLLHESNSTGTSANAEQWSGVALPLVRRIFAEISAKDFVSVQPMNLPSGLIFYMDFKYGTAQAGFNNTHSNESPLTPEYWKDSVYGVTNDSGDAHNGLYGAGRFGYSINDVTSPIITLAAGDINVLNFVAGATPTDDYVANHDSKFIAMASSLQAGGGLYYEIKVAKTSLPGLDANGIRAFQIARAPGTPADIDAYYPQFTKIDATYVYFIVYSSSTIAAAQTVAVSYHKQPESNSRGDFEDATGADINIPELNVELRSEPIVAKTRKLKAVWSPEFAQDLNAYHSIDAEAELTSLLSEYISQEIDVEILDMLMQNALTIEAWSTIVGYTYDSYNNTFSSSVSLAAAEYNQQEWFQTLGTKIQKVSNKIHQKTLRGGANFLICSPDIATVLESIPGYSADTDGNQAQFAMGVQKVGLLNNRFTVYKNPYMTENAILMGFRGAQFLETGAVFAPYIPLIMTPMVYDPSNFTPRKGVLTRYAKKLVRPEYYGKIYIHGLNTL